MRVLRALLFALFASTLLSMPLFSADACLLPERPPAQFRAVPDQWRGLNYFPRGHHFYDMLNDWWTRDRITGKFVHEMAANDMAAISVYGGNFFHLYIWDEAWFGVGFKPVGQDPCASRNRQWEALDDFLSKAERYGLFVGIHFVTKPVIDGLQAGISREEAEKLGEAYAAWTLPFIEILSRRHGNIALWGVAYALGPIADVEADVNPWNAFFKSAYRRVHAQAKMYAPFPGLGKVGINIATSARVQEDKNHYQWDMAAAQRAAHVMLEMGLPEPDVYMVQMYNANSMDLARDLSLLTGPPLAPDALTIHPEKIFVVEFGNSSSLAPAPYGMRLAGYGDAHAPSLTLEGQAEWLTNTLCAFQKTGIAKMAYWTLYDAYDFMQKDPFRYTGFDLAWNGYWGLIAHDETKAYGKPSFWALSRFYRDKYFTCAGPQPVLALMASHDTAYEGEPITLTWTATDVDTLEITDVGAVAGSYGTVQILPSAAGVIRFTLIGQNAFAQRTAFVEVRVLPARTP